MAQRAINPDALVGFFQTIFPNVDGDKIIATIRTVVPVFIGSALTSLVSLVPGIADWLTGVYSDWRLVVATLATTLVTGLYYAIARKIESKYPKAGKWLLGSAAKPIYVNPAEDVIPDA